MNCEVARSLLQERVVTGALDPPEAGVALEQHLPGGAACRDERESLDGLVVGIPEAVLAVEPASPAARERLLVDTRHGRALPSFAGAVARLFDLPREQARALLVELEQPGSWGPGVVAGNWMRPIRLGPSLEGSAVGMMLRTTPGTVLPNHRHDGPERTYVLQGGYRDSAGGEVWAGEYSNMPGSSQHELHVLEPVECIAAVLVHGGFHLVR